MSTEYEKILVDALTHLRDISIQAEELEVERAKLIQFIKATLNLLPEEKQKRFIKLLQMVHEMRTPQAESLTDAIRKVMRTEGDWLTAAEVRDRLIQTGFDFSQYASNPLASVSTTLRRIAEKEPETTQSRVIEGVTTYRWKESRTNLALRDMLTQPKGTVRLGAIFDALARGEKKQ